MTETPLKPSDPSPRAPRRGGGRYRIQGTLRGALVFFACIAGLVRPMAASAQDSADGGTTPDARLLPAYPKGSIRDLETAERAAREAAKERDTQELRYSAARKKCYEQFFSERCLNEARGANYRASARIREVELEAADFRRREDVRQRRIRRDERAAKEAAQAPGRAIDGARVAREREQRAAGKERDARELQDGSGARQARAREEEKRRREREAAISRRSAESAAEAPARAERAREREAKVRETLERARRKEADAAKKERKLKGPDAPPPIAAEQP